LPQSVRACFRQTIASPYDEHEVVDGQAGLAVEVTSRSVRRQTKNLWS